MERLSGEPIKKRMARLYDEVAAAQGKTRAELEAEFKRQLADPKELQKLMAQAPPTSFQIQCARLYMRAWDVVLNTVGRLTGRAARWSTLPLDAPALMRLIFNVHAHQLFEDGVFNADPHAGNILICEDGRLGLVDFGNVQ